jgi:hypothetical protein
VLPFTATDGRSAKADASISRQLLAWSVRHEPTTHRAADALSVHLLPDLGIALPQGPYATVVGLILDQLGALSGKG